MNNEFEKQYDTEEPPKCHQQRMQSRLDEAFGKRRDIWPLWYKVAAVLLLGFISVWYFIEGEGKKQIQSAEKNEVMPQEHIPMDQAEHYYKQSFQTQFKLLAKQNQSAESKIMIESSMEMIANLDEEYRELEKELSKTGDQRVAAAMIKNYKQRIEILETLIQKINYVNHLKQSKNENTAA